MVCISGKIVDWFFDILILIKVYEDFWYYGVWIFIWVDSIFSYEFICSEIEEYFLIFFSEWLNGVWCLIYFFLDGEEIEFILYDGM